MAFPSLAKHFVEAVHDTEKTKVLEQQMQATSVAMGTLDESQVSGIIALAMAKARKAHLGGIDSISEARFPEISCQPSIHSR